MSHNIKRILAFGTFDTLHKGHEFFLRSAKARGSELVVGVALDSHVRKLKNKTPINNEQRRKDAVAKFPFVDAVLLCDEQLGSFDIVEQTKPDVIVLGHDQYELEQALINWMSSKDIYIPMIRIKKTE